MLSQLRELARQGRQEVWRFTRRGLETFLEKTAEPASHVTQGEAAPPAPRVEVHAPVVEAPRPPPPPPAPPLPPMEPFTELAAVVAQNRSIGAMDGGFAAGLNSARETIDTLGREGAILAADIQGKRILDWECGRGAFSAVFLERGASAVTAIDSWLDVAQTASTLGAHPDAKYARISVEKFSADAAHQGQYDFIFANTVTEHLPQLAQAFIQVYRLLAPNGVLVINHDNYYQPCGSHDHGFLFYDDKFGISFQGTKCWEAEAKCAASAEHRAGLKQRLPWTWDAEVEARLSPNDCTQCPYFKRAQPWAHLLHQAEFRSVFPQSGFTTGYSNSSLNKITLFQLRQFLTEAGFDLERWCPHPIANEPPAQLLAPPFGFHVDDLKTATVAVRCRKAPQPRYT